MNIPDNWLPTSENINALPAPLRKYIHDLETRADPAGEVAELTLTKDQNAQLQVALNAALKRVQEVEKQLDDSRELGIRQLNV